MGDTKAPVMASIRATINATMTAPAMSLDTVWMTYAELAERLGIAGESARNLVRRREWPRKPGNDGQQRVGVPLEYLDERTKEEVAPPSPVVEAIVEAVVVAPEAPVAEDITPATVAALEAHIALLRDLVDRERARGDAERDQAESARRRSEVLTDQMLAMRTAGDAQAAALRGDLDKLRGDLDGLRRKPWWARLVG